MADDDRAKYYNVVPGDPIDDISTVDKITNWLSLQADAANLRYEEFKAGIDLEAKETADAIAELLSKHNIEPSDTDTVGSLVDKVKDKVKKIK